MKQCVRALEEILKILDIMRPKKKYPVFLGANKPMNKKTDVIETDAAKFIIEEAMKDDPRPLYIGMQGALTDLACAILMEPNICNKMTCIWVGGGDYPNGGNEFNLMNDVIAANIVFGSNMPLWQIPKYVYKQFTVSLSELQVKVMPYGEIGQYLLSSLLILIIRCLISKNWPHGEVWTLGDEGCICALLGRRSTR